MKINKAVITAAGLGTRLLPVTKEQVKEMLPIFTSNIDGGVCVKPLLQFVFEQLHDFGIRDVCFIVGRGKRVIEDHFTPDDDLLKLLETDGKTNLSDGLKLFYSTLEDVDITWKSQLRPKGFGDAVYRAKSFVQSDNFLLFAGDVCIVSKNNNFLKRLVETHNRFNAAATVVVERVPDPERHGVIVGKEIERGVYKVSRIIEKPKNPESNLAAAAVYIFNPVIFKALEQTDYNKKGEKELTDAIQLLIDWGLDVYAEELGPDEIRLDIGTPEAYKLALHKSYEILL